MTLTAVPIEIAAELSQKCLDYITELVEENYALDDILEFLKEYNGDDLIAYYVDYVKAGENIGYDVVDAFVKHQGSICYAENAEDAFHGVYYDEETFAEEYYNNVYGGDSIPAFLVVDWKATWEQSLSYDFDFVDGYVFSSSF